MIKVNEIINAVTHMERIRMIFSLRFKRRIFINKGESKKIAVIIVKRIICLLLKFTPFEKEKASTSAKVGPIKGKLIKYVSSIVVKSWIEINDFG